jgi:hypothetical protein
MVINFNLILVWIPMCKYTLTKLAVIACEHNQKQRMRLTYLVSRRGLSSPFKGHSKDSPQKDATHQIVQMNAFYQNDDNSSPNRLSLRVIVEKLKMIVDHANLRIQLFVCKSKIKAINSFLIAVDHSTSLHTISATTITLASGKFGILE